MRKPIFPTIFALIVLGVVIGVLIVVLSSCAPPISTSAPIIKGVPAVTIEFRQLIDRDDNMRAYRIEDTEKGVVCYIPAAPFASGQPAISCVKK